MQLSPIQWLPYLSWLREKIWNNSKRQKVPQRRKMTRSWIQLAWSFFHTLLECNESASFHCNCSLIKIQLSVSLLFTLMIIQLIVAFLPTENWMKKEICILTEHAARENNKWKSKARFPDDCMQKNQFAWEFTLSITTGSLPLMAFFWWKWYKHLIFLRRKSVMFKSAQNRTLSQRAQAARPGRTQLWMPEFHTQHPSASAQFMRWLSEKEIIM